MDSSRSLLSGPHRGAADGNLLFACAFANLRRDSAGPSHTCLRTLVGGVRLVVVLRRDCIAFVQRGVSLKVGALQFEIGLGIGNGLLRRSDILRAVACLRKVQFSSARMQRCLVNANLLLIICIVQARKQLSGIYLLSFFHRQRHNPALGAEAYNALVRLHVAGEQKRIRRCLVWCK